MIALTLSGCSELESADCAVQVSFSKSVASSFTICDTEVIALKRSGEHIKGASTIFVVGNSLQTRYQ